MIVDKIMSIESGARRGFIRLKFNKQGKLWAKAGVGRRQVADGALWFTARRGALVFTLVSTIVTKIDRIGGRRSRILGTEIPEQS